MVQIGSPSTHDEQRVAQAYRSIGRDPFYLASLIQFDYTFPEIHKAVELSNTMVHSELNPELSVNIIATSRRPNAGKLIRRVAHFMASSAFNAIYPAGLRFSPASQDSVLRFSTHFKISYAPMVKAMMRLYTPSDSETLGTASASAFRPVFYVTVNGAKTTPVRPDLTDYRYFLRCYHQAITEARDAWIAEDYLKPSFL